MKYTLKKEIISYYYSEVYNKIWGQFESPLSLLWLFEKYMERLSPTYTKNVLEIGGGEGQHLKYVKKMPSEKYVIIDPLLPSRKFISEFTKSYPKIIFVKGVAEKIPFDDCSFDHIKSTCVLAHVDDPYLALMEMRRVTKLGGEIIIMIPTDPGLFNIMIKKIYTYRRINKISKFPADLIYALDHKNSVNNILTLIKYVFRSDKIYIRYLPFLFKSNNLNLVCIVKIIIK